MGHSRLCAGISDSMTHSVDMVRRLPVLDARAEQALYGRWSDQHGVVAADQTRGGNTYITGAAPSSVAVVSEFLDAALRTWEDDRVHAKSQVRIAVSILRDYAIDLPTDLPRQVDKPNEGLAPWKARRVKEFIDESLDSKIRLHDCANKVNLSVSYFTHAFKATFGVTLSDYIRRRRIERAQQLMLASYQPLSQIATACGFAHQSHYCRVFRSVIGLTPNVWRRHHMMEPDEE